MTVAFLGSTVHLDVASSDVVTLNWGANPSDFSVQKGPLFLGCACVPQALAFQAGRNLFPYYVLDKHHNGQGWLSRRSRLAFSDTT